MSIRKFSSRRTAPATDWTQTEITLVTRLSSVHLTVVSMVAWTASRRHSGGESRAEPSNWLTEGLDWDQLTWERRDDGGQPGGLLLLRLTETETGHNSLTARPPVGRPPTPDCLSAASLVPHHPPPQHRQVWNLIFCLENLFGCCWYSSQPDGASVLSSELQLQIVVDKPWWIYWSHYTDWLCKH